MSLVVTASIYDITATREFNFTVLKTQEDKVFDISDYDVLGFAEGNVSIPNISEDDPSYYKVSNELEFLDAIKTENNTKNGTHAARIIEITADLNLGYNEVIEKYPQVAVDYRSIFQTHNSPSLHPILIESGISKIRLENRDGSNAKYNEGLMIFSKNKNTIKHATFSVKRAKNIIIRNLKFDELWEWDESGDYDSKDWDYFTVESTSGIWFDHIELGKAYDGLIDFKYGNPAVDGATFTFLNFNFQPNDFIKAQLEHFESNGGSYGIGFAIGSGLAKAGATLVFNDINQELVDKGLKAYEEVGIKAIGYVCDITNEDEVLNMVADIEKKIGSVDILVNNAGIIKRIPMHEMSAADFRKVIDIDLTGQFIVAKAVIPAMMKKRSGKIINICSMMSELGRETVSAYASAKGGLKMLTRNIAAEYGEYGIQCNGLGPGYIETPQTAPIRVDGHPFNDFIINKTPAARWGKTDDLVGPAIFLASKASDFVNGHILYVDGGILASIGKQPKA